MYPREPGQLQRLPVIVLAALAMLWPALVNGGVFFATDSIAYIRGPDQAAMKLFGPRAGTVWSAKTLGMGYAAGKPGAAPASAAKSEAPSPPMAGRSIYYGLLANLGARTGGFWLTVLVQSLCAMLALDLLCRAVGWTRISTFVALAGAAAFLSPLAFIEDCVMPDAWTPILVLVTAALCAGWDRLKLSDLAVAGAIMVYAATTHTTHLLLLLAMAAAGGLLVLARTRFRFRVGAPGLAAAAAITALLAGAISGAVFNFAVTRAYGSPPVQPPFLTARLVGDGRPGDVWLRRHCPDKRFQACAYVARLPMATDVFLWSDDPAKSAFWTATSAERRALGKEQFGFYLTVLAADPLGVARQIAVDGATQFADPSLVEVNHKDSVRAGMESWMAGPDALAWRQSLAFRKGWPTGVMDFVQLCALAVAFGGLVALSLRARGHHRLRPDDDRLRILLAAVVIVVAYLANAVVCGGLSDIFGRYQARVTAPLILVGFMALSSLFSSPSRLSNLR